MKIQFRNWANGVDIWVKNRAFYLKIQIIELLFFQMDVEILHHHPDLGVIIHLLYLPFEIPYAILDPEEM